VKKTDEGDEGRECSDSMERATKKWEFKTDIILPELGARTLSPEVVAMSGL